MAAKSGCLFLVLVILGSSLPDLATAQDGNFLDRALNFLGTIVRTAADGFSESEEESPSPSPTEYYDVSAEGYVPASQAGSDSTIGAREVWSSLTNTFISGVDQLFNLRPACSTGTIGIFTGCAEQFQYLVQEFGYPLFYPRVTPDKFTPQFLRRVPVPDRASACCYSARLFQGAQCACDVETIRAMRDMGMFDPEMTVIFAEYLYGTLCGARTSLAEDCPNGSPFEILRAEG